MSIVLKSRFNANEAANVSFPSFYHLILILLFFILRIQHSVSCFIYKAYEFVILEFIVQFVSIVQPSGVNLHGNHRLQTKLKAKLKFCRLYKATMSSNAKLFIIFLKEIEFFATNYFLLNPSQLITNGERERLN